MRQSFAVMTVLVLAVPQQGLSQVFRGRVIDHASSAILSDVRVQLIDQTGREAAQTTTDESGRFQLSVSNDGHYRVEASLFGYAATTSEMFDIERNETVELLIRLAVEPVPLSALVVMTRHDGSRLAEFEQRRARHAGGHFITRQDVEHRPIANPSELLIGVPGVTLLPKLSGGGVPQDRYTIGFYGRTHPCVAHLFVNGVEVSQRSATTIDDLLVTDWIAGVEVYPSAVVAPVEYRRSDPCGVVLFWTRDPETGTSWHWIKVAAAAAFVGVAYILTR